MLPWCLAELVGKVRTGSLEVSDLHVHSRREVLTLPEWRIFRHSHTSRQIQTDLALKPRAMFPYQSLITRTGFDLVKILWFVATVAQILLSTSATAWQSSWDQGGCFTWWLWCIFFFCDAEFMPLNSYELNRLQQASHILFLEPRAPERAMTKTVL